MVSRGRAETSGDSFCAILLTGNHMNKRLYYNIAPHIFATCVMRTCTAAAVGSPEYRHPMPVIAAAQKSHRDIDQYDFRRVLRCDDDLGFVVHGNTIARLGGLAVHVDRALQRHEIRAAPGGQRVPHAFACP